MVQGRPGRRSKKQQMLRVANETKRQKREEWQKRDEELRVQPEEFESVTMPPPPFPLEVLLMIARLLTDKKGKLRFADFNSFLQVNRALYACLNRTLWREAVGVDSITHRVFTHLIRINDLAHLEFFLELGADTETVLLEVIDEDEDTFYETRDWPEVNPLKFAVQLDNVPMARLLLEHGANLVHPDRRGKPGYSAIHAARSAEMVQLLLDHHADPEQQFANPPLRYRPLDLYAMRNNIGAMRVALQNGVAANASKDMFTTPPLHYAVSRSIESVKLLLEHGADLNTRDSFGETVLHLAAEAGKADVLRLLLERWPEGILEKNPWHKNTPLHSAAEMGYIDVVRVLLEHSPEGIREKGSEEATALHLAARGGKANVVKLLLERWPEAAREEDEDGNTPLHLAAKEGKTNVVKLFLERWPEATREKDRDGNVLLHLAARKGKTNLVKLLLERWPGAIREQDEYGNTPLHLAAEWRRIAVVRLLVENWPEGKKALNKRGQTPLSVFGQQKLQTYKRWKRRQQAEQEFEEEGRLLLG